MESDTTQASLLNLKDDSKTKEYDLEPTMKQELAPQRQKRHLKGQQQHVLQQKLQRLRTDIDQLKGQVSTTQHPIALCAASIHPASHEPCLPVAVCMFVMTFSLYR
jgi:septal ring factor EnvC (AmiA/AmiB activator)